MKKNEKKEKEKKVSPLANSLHSHKELCTQLPPMKLLFEDLFSLSLSLTENEKKTRQHKHGSLQRKE